MKAAGSFLALSVLLTVCRPTLGQFPFPGDGGRFRHPGIQQYYSYYCRNVQCSGIEDVCERRVYPCLVPPCPYGPGCVPTPGSITKPGRCPPPWFIWAWDVECNTDYGCSGDNICCHGYRGSQCRRPF